MKKHLITITLLLSMESNIMAKNNNQPIVVHDKKFTLSIPQENINQRVRAIAQEITKDFAGKKPVIIGVLNGAFIFLSDLIRELEIECEIDFIKISSYGDATSSSGKISLLQDVVTPLTDRVIIIVEDIIDSGLSINFVKDHLSSFKPRSIRIAALLDKNISNVTFPIDYVGFYIKPELVIGYGLDYAQLARNLKGIYTLVE